jgi:hypothetical protein
LEVCLQLLKLQQHHIYASIPSLQHVLVDEDALVYSYDDHLGLQLLKLRILLLELRQKAIEGFSMLETAGWYCIRNDIDDVTCASRSCMACCLSVATSCSFCDSIDLAFCAIHGWQFLVLGQKSHVKLHHICQI